MNRIVRMLGFNVVAIALFALPLTVSVAEGGAGQTIVVGGNRAYPPYEFLDADGNPAGFNVDLTRAIAKVMGMQVEFRFGDWAEMRRSLDAGTIDILQGISYSEERDQSLDFAPPHAIIHHAVFARIGAAPVHSLEALRGKKVVVFKEGIMYDTLRGMGFADNLVPTATPAEVMRLLASGEHDYAVVAILPGMYLIRELRLSNLTPVAQNVAAQKYGYAVRKGNAELLARFSEGLAIVQQTGQYRSIYDKWLGVDEPQRLSLAKMLRYGAMVVVPLLLVLVATVVWSRALQRRVAERTAELATEAAERKRALEELQRHQDKLIQADKMASLGILVSGVAHEINNPTALVLLNAPILREAFSDALVVLEDHYCRNGDFPLGGLPYSRMRGEIPKLVDEVQDGARRIRRIVEDLKDFSRRDDATVSTLFELNPVVEAALRLVEPMIRKRTDDVTLALAPALPRVCGSPQRLEQVVINLVLNACQALPESAGAIAVATRHDAATGEILLEVCDNGVGIPSEHLPHLTDPFFTTKRESGGTGLGLSICAGIVEKHGGTLTFASRPGETVVTVRLPVFPREFAP